MWRRWKVIYFLFSKLLKFSHFSKCLNGECVKYDFICDNKKSCIDGSDENCADSKAINLNYTECIQIFSYYHY